MEPESIAVTENSKTAYVTLQVGREAAARRNLSKIPHIHTSGRSIAVDHLPVVDTVFDSCYRCKRFSGRVSTEQSRSCARSIRSHTDERKGNR